MSSVWHYSLIYVFLCLLLNVYPVMTIGVFISVVLRIFFITDVSALLYPIGHYWSYTCCIDFDLALRLFFQIGCLRGPDIATALSVSSFRLSEILYLLPCIAGIRMI